MGVAHKPVEEWLWPQHSDSDLNLRFTVVAIHVPLALHLSDGERSGPRLKDE